MYKCMYMCLCSVYTHVHVPCTCTCICTNVHVHVHVQCTCIYLYTCTCMYSMSYFLQLDDSCSVAIFFGLSQLGLELLQLILTLCQPGVFSSQSSLREGGREGGREGRRKGGREEGKQVRNGERGREGGKNGWTLREHLDMKETRSTHLPLLGLLTDECGRLLLNLRLLSQALLQVRHLPGHDIT